MAPMKKRGDLDAVRPLDDVDDGRVGEDQRDHAEDARSAPAARRCARPSVTATAAEVISTSTPVA